MTLGMVFLLDCLLFAAAFRCQYAGVLGVRRTPLQNTFAGAISPHSLRLRPPESALVQPYFQCYFSLATFLPEKELQTCEKDVKKVCDDSGKKDRANRQDDRYQPG